MRCELFIVGEIDSQNKMFSLLEKYIRTPLYRPSFIAAMFDLYSKIFEGQFEFFGLIKSKIRPCCDLVLVIGKDFQ